MAKVNKELLSYIGNIIFLEKSVYTQEQIIADMEEKMEELGLDRYIEIPLKEHAKAEFPMAMLGAIAGCIIGFVWGFAAYTSLSDMFFLKPFMGIVIGAIIGICIDISFISNEDKRLNNEYEMKLEEYCKKKDENAERIKMELIEKDRMYELYSELYDQYESTIELLNSYYDKNIIYPKYRDLVALCTIYEYLVSGRCLTLEGRNGAYNKYDIEDKLGQILSKLDIVIEKLDEIMHTQHILYRAITESNQMVQQLIEQSNRQIQLAEYNLENSAISAYCAQQQLEENKQMKWLVHHDAWCIQNNVNII